MNETDTDDQSDCNEFCNLIGTENIPLERLYDKGKETDQQRIVRQRFNRTMSGSQDPVILPPQAGDDSETPEVGFAGPAAQDPASSGNDRRVSIMFLMSFSTQYTEWCHYDAVIFLPNSHYRQHIARPWGGDMECLLWF